MARISAISDIEVGPENLSGSKEMLAELLFENQMLWGTFNWFLRHMATAEQRAQITENMEQQLVAVTKTAEMGVLKRIEEFRNGN